ncbi:hypothetical protein Tco_1423852, partial [Tanacetum coccineum]
TSVPNKPRADTSFVQWEFEPLIDLTYKKLKEVAVTRHSSLVVLRNSLELKEQLAYYHSWKNWNKRSGNCYNPTLGRPKEVVDGRILSGNGLVVQIPLSNREILEVHGEWPERNLKQLKTMKVNELKLEDILVVHEEDIPKTAFAMRRFITNFSKIAKPLTLLTLKNKKFEWGDEQEITFQTLKDILCDALILALPEGADDFVVKGNVVADVLSRKERSKPRRARAMSMTIHFSIKAKILEAQSEASKGVNTLAEMLKGLDKQFERNEDGKLYLAEQIWVPVYGNLRTLIMIKAYATSQSITPETLGITSTARDSRMEMGEHHNGLHKQVNKNSCWVLEGPTT